MTLRQLYYQFVARDIIPNKSTEYDRLGSIINDARLAGLIDWEVIVDRTRGVEGNAHWERPADILESAKMQYQIDKRSTQETYLEVWIEKDALKGVISSVYRRNDIYYLSCRGYTSLSEVWAAGNRINSAGKSIATIIHLGDHDPSGIDMTRDIGERLSIFCEDVDVQIKRIALNFDQVKKYNPPPNPAKTTDSRFGGYVRKYGKESWELDALNPSVIVDLIQKNIDKYTDKELYYNMKGIEDEHKNKLQDLIDSLEE